jgi:hypothetical protein
MDKSGEFLVKISPDYISLISSIDQFEMKLKIGQLTSIAENIDPDVIYAGSTGGCAYGVLTTDITDINSSKVFFGGRHHTIGTPVVGVYVSYEKGNGTFAVFKDSTESAPGDSWFWRNSTGEISNSMHQDPSGHWRQSDAVFPADQPPTFKMLDKQKLDTHLVFDSPSLGRRRTYWVSNPNDIFFPELSQALVPLIGVEQGPTFIANLYPSTPPVAQRLPLVEQDNTCAKPRGYCTCPDGQIFATCDSSLSVSSTKY